MVGAGEFNRELETAEGGVACPLQAAISTITTKVRMNNRVIALKYIHK
jgi:hypothetical protein